MECNHDNPHRGGVAGLYHIVTSCIYMYMYRLYRYRYGIATPEGSISICILFAYIHEYNESISHIRSRPSGAASEKRHSLTGGISKRPSRSLASAQTRTWQNFRASDLGGALDNL